jgi:hypothetical protein
MAAELRELREDYAAGRLTLDEFAARVGDALRGDPMGPVHSGPFDSHLVAGEKILWLGRPDPSRRFERSDLFLVPFSLLWGGFAFFWEAAVIAHGSFLGTLWGIPFVALGLHMIAGRFVYKAWLRRRTVYAVTDRRVLKLVRRRSGDSVNGLFLDAVPAVNRELRGDGSGSVIFGTASSSTVPTSFMGLRTPSQDALAFEDIPNAAHVAELVTELRRS